MRCLAPVADTSEHNNFAEFILDKELAALILTARKKLKEMKTTAGLGLESLNALRFLAPNRVKYFPCDRLGDEGEDGSDPLFQKDLLTEDQRDNLNNEEIAVIDDELKLHIPPHGEVYSGTSIDWLMVTETKWWFESWLEGGGTYLVEMWAQNFDILQQVL